MKLLQQDDIFDAQFYQQRQRYYFNNKIVKAVNRKDAIEKFKKHYNIDVMHEQLTNDKLKQILIQNTKEYHECPNGCRGKISYLKSDNTHRVCGGCGSIWNILENKIINL